MAEENSPGKLIVILVGAVVALGVVIFFVWPMDTQRADPNNAASVAVGQALYAEHCASCHGVNLEGQPNWRTPNEDGSLPAPPHDQSGHTWHHGDQLLFDYTKGGGAAVAPADFKTGMPGFGDVLSDTEIWDVLAFIKSSWPEDIRKAQAARSQ